MRHYFASAALCILLLTGLSAADAAAPATVTAVEVKSVIDSCTFEVINNKKTDQVRLLNLTPPLANTLPEKNRCEELAADRDLRLELPGKTVYLEFDSEQRDENGRLLAYMWLAKPETGNLSEIAKKMLNAKLLLYGYAEWSPKPASQKYIGELLSMETSAYFGERGIWEK